MRVSAQWQNRKAMDQRSALIWVRSTTLTCVDVVRNGKVEVIANEHEQGNYITPSFGKMKVRLVMLQSNQQPQTRLNTIFDAKLMIGCKFGNPVVQRYLPQWLFKVNEVNEMLKSSTEMKSQNNLKLSKKYYNQNISGQKSI